MTRTDPITAAGSSPRAHRRAAVVRLLSTGPRSRAQLARDLGVSATTAAGLVEELAAAGLVTESTETDRRGRGRPARVVALRPPQGVVVGVDVGRTHLRTALAARDGRVLAERSVPLPLGHAPARTGPDALALVDELLTDAGLAREHLAGLGVGLPGPVDSATGTVGAGTILSGWAGHDLAGWLGAQLGIPAAAENDANLGALAQSRWGDARGVADAVYVKVSTGIGAGLLLDGKLHRGTGGTAGELGHSPVEPDGAVCRCGNRGCLETLAAVPAVLELLRPTMGADLTVEEVVGHARAGDPACRRVLEDAGRHLGRGLAMLCNIVDPELVLVGGPLVAAGDLYLTPVRRSLARSAIPAVSEHVRIESAGLADRAEVLGAVALALDVAPDPYLTAHA